MPVGWLRELINGDLVVVRQVSRLKGVDCAYLCRVESNGRELLEVVEISGAARFAFDRHSGLYGTIGAGDAIGTLSIYPCDEKVQSLAAELSLLQARLQEQMKQCCNRKGRL